MFTICYIVCYNTVGHVSASDPPIGPSLLLGPICGSSGLYKGRYMSPLCYKIYVQLIYLQSAQIISELRGQEGMHVKVLNWNTMHDHGTESRGHVLFRVTRGNTSGMCIETRSNLFQSVSSQTNTIGESQHGLKQIKLCFNSRAGCETALHSDGRLCLQSYYSMYTQYLYYAIYPATLLPWYTTFLPGSFQRKNIRSALVYGFAI